MDAFLAPLSLIFSHSATALLLQIMNRLTQKSIHSGFTFVIKQPLNHIDPKKRPAGRDWRDGTLYDFVYSFR